MPLVTLALASAAGAGAAWWWRGLSPRGALAAFVIAVAIGWSAGWAGLAALCAFFVSGTLLSHLERRGLPRLPRTTSQVIANGGPPAALGVLAVAMGQSDAALVAVTCGLASACADTWATGVGATSSRPPRNILTRQPAVRGTSGAISAKGTLGAVPGALIVALASSLASGHVALIPLATIVGMGGMIADSVMGAAFQARFVCTGCGVPTELRRHCDRPARTIGGIAWITNDEVNALATALAGGAGLLGWHLLS